MADGVIVFRSAQRTRDADGIYRNGETETREVYCQVHSVTRSEFFSGGQNGLRPEYMFTVFPAEYRGEEECEYEGEAYAIYRTHRSRADELEIYVEQRGGVARGQENGD